MNYEEVVEYILSIPKFAKKIGTDNLKILLDHLGNPHLKIKCIHVAGTNGKGSTSMFISDLLIGNGYKVGMFSSPHLVKINERFRINKQLINDEEFVECFCKVEKSVKELQEAGYPHPSFFEYVFAIGAVWFERRQVDYVIYETGMGGRLDATNIVEPEVTIITSVGYDHMQYLGNTIEEIAKEKAGIIKSLVPIIYFKRDRESSRIIEGVASSLDSKVYAVDNSNYIIDKIGDKTIDFSFDCGYYSYVNISIKKTAIYQIENSILAIIAVNILLNKRLDTDNINNILSESYWEGRMEEILTDVYVDGAHNTEAIEAFTDTVLKCYNDKDIILIFAVANDKDYVDMIKYLCDKLVFSRIYVTSIKGDRTTAAYDILNIFDEYCDSRVEIIDNSREEFKCIIDSKKNSERIFCVGSLYLIGDIKEQICIDI